MVHIAKVIHDIDEEACRQITIELVDEGLDRTTIACLRSLNSFHHSDFFDYEYKGIKIFQKKCLSPKDRIKAKMLLWLYRIEESDLKEVDRIYISEKMMKDILGSFTPVLNVIWLLWKRPGLFHDLSREYTLYHEIGHHVNNHQGGPRDTEFERQANEYADGVFLRFHSKWSRFAARPLQAIAEKME